MSKRYVIDLPDDAQYILINGASENHCYTRMERVDDLEELNSNYINENFGSLQDEAMNKVWQLAEDVIYNRGNVLDILRCATVGAAFDKYSARQALDILKGYESRQKDRIEVGDEVKWENVNFTVLRVFKPKGCYEQCDGFDSDGNGYTNILTKDVKKTGKHYDMTSIMEAMKS